MKERIKEFAGGHEILDAGTRNSLGFLQNDPGRKVGGTRLLYDQSRTFIQLSSR